jgi:hypothetical protein
MQSIAGLKEQNVTETPLFLFDCELTSGDVEHWSTHAVTVNQQAYQPRVVRHNLYEIQLGSPDGVDAMSRISLTLANADSYGSQIERNTGWKGANLTVTFLFFDLKNGVAASESVVQFIGIANPPDQTTESEMRLSFMNRMSLLRVGLPCVQIERRCPWSFPATAEQRQEALTGGTDGQYSLFYPCGYSPDISNGVGNLNQGVPYTTCDYSRTQCEARGMFSLDSQGNATRRFGGIEFVPPSTLVRSYGDKSYHLSTPAENVALYNDYVPLVYGTAWYAPPIVFANNDGNLTRMEVLLGSGPINEVLTVLVNDIVIPLGVTGTDMTGTGWYNVVSLGSRTGAFNPDYHDAAGNPAGDPYGSMAFLSVVVPNAISDGTTLPRVKVLVEGLTLFMYNADGTVAGESFTNNPAWIIVDILRRCGWALDELDMASFVEAANYCGRQIETTDLNGNAVSCAQFQCNLVLQKRRSAADVVRGIRNGSMLFLTYGSGGTVQLNAEGPFALQQPTLPGGSNSTQEIDGGWSGYDFGDSAPLSGIVRKADGSPNFRVFTRSTADTPNCLSLEFQDQFNEYQQDSLSLVAVDDVVTAGQQISATFAALGIPNVSQAARVIAFNLTKSIQGNTFIEFETSVRAIGLTAGDLITVTYAKEGWEMQPFRIVTIAPGMNYWTAVITAQIHSDAWYGNETTAASGTGRQASSNTGVPRPLAGSVVDASGESEFQIQEESTGDAGSVTISAAFTTPRSCGICTVGIPLLSLAPGIDATQGTLAGGQTLYYAISALDGQGTESPLSFVVRATIPPGGNTNTVTLTGLSFSALTQGFQVYRGVSPMELFQIAANQPVAAQFADTGLPSQLVPPPDENYDHANFYWRLELQPEAVATNYSANSIGNSTLQMAAGEFNGMTVRITQGTGAGQERTVASNTADTLTMSAAWTVEPDNASSFVVAESSWHFGASTTASPVAFEIPYRPGATVHISGRSANVYDEECAYELSPLTRWQISDSGGGDSSVPGQPLFGLAATGRGNVGLSAVGFQDLANTSTITAATLTLHYWDELQSPSQITLGAAMAADDASLTLAAPGLTLEEAGEVSGSLIQIDQELLTATGVVNNGLQCQVTRGAQGTTASSHDAGTPVYQLEEKIFIVPFVPGFFGSPASGSFSYPISIPDVRIASAELFVTNSQGNSPATIAPYTASADSGLRTVSGGQFSIQVEGYLAIQNGAAPVVVVEDAHAVRDLFAVVQEAPTGAPVDLEVTVNGASYCELEIPAGSTMSNIVNGFGMAPLLAGSQIGLNVLAEGQTAGTTPGSDLTVIVRL